MVLLKLNLLDHAAGMRRAGNNGGNIRSRFSPWKISVLFLAIAFFEDNSVLNSINDFYLDIRCGLPGDLSPQIEPFKTSETAMQLIDRIGWLQKKSRPKLR